MAHVLEYESVFNVRTATENHPQMPLKCKCMLIQNIHSSEAVLTCTHYVCFERKSKKIDIF